MIIQITNICNFGCSFCSASQLDRGTLSADQVIGLIKKHNPIEVNIEGGDPLAISPSILSDIADYVIDNALDTELTLTTNLWGWYKNPEKWDSVLRKYSICTSFQYGNKRKLLDGTVYDEALFVDVIENFKKTFNKNPSFISVIDSDNASYAINHCQLAKQLSTTCSLQRTRASGRSVHSFPYSHIIKIYEEIITSGLFNYELNSRQLYRIMTNDVKEQYCTFGIHNCANKMLYFDNKGLKQTCMSMFHPLTIPSKRLLISPKCVLCDCVDLCNTCVATKSQLSMATNSVLDKHCNIMKSSFKKIKDYVSSL